MGKTGSVAGLRRVVKNYDLVHENFSSELNGSFPKDMGKIELYFSMGKIELYFSYKKTGKFHDLPEATW